VIREPWRGFGYVREVSNRWGAAVIGRARAQEFARERIEAWSAHDFKRILGRRGDEFELTKPLLVERIEVGGKGLGVPAAALHGSRREAP
jgi:hypothetical protein